MCCGLRVSPSHWAEYRQLLLHLANFIRMGYYKALSDWNIILSSLLIGWLKIESKSYLYIRNEITLEYGVSLTSINPKCGGIWITRRYFNQFDWSTFHRLTYGVYRHNIRFDTSKVIQKSMYVRHSVVVIKGQPMSWRLKWSNRIKKENVNYFIW